MTTPTISSKESGAIANFLKAVKDNKGKIFFGLIAVVSIAIGTLAKLDQLGVKLPNGFSKDAAFATSFAPLGFLGLYLLYSKIKDNNELNHALQLIERVKWEYADPNTVIAVPDDATPNT